MTDAIGFLAIIALVLLPIWWPFAVRGIRPHIAKWIFVGSCIVWLSATGYAYLYFRHRDPWLALFITCGAMWIAFAAKNVFFVRNKINKEKSKIEDQYSALF